MLKIVFLLYDSRSGSTLLSRLLDEQRDVIVTVESDFMVSLIHLWRSPTRPRDVRTLIDRWSHTGRFSHLGISPEDLIRAVGDVNPSQEVLVRRLLSLYADSNKPRAEVCVVKDGSNGFHLNTISRELPDALFIHLLRDGRAVFNSRLKSIRPYGSGESMARDALSAARAWKGLVQNVDRFSEKYPERMLEIRYEHLVQDSGTVLADIRRFSGLPIHSEHSSSPVGNTFLNNMDEREKGIHRLVDHPPQNSRIDAWRDELDPLQRRVFEFSAGDILLRKGYSSFQGINSWNLLTDPPLLKEILRCHALRIKGWCEYIANPQLGGKVLRIKFNKWVDR